MTTFTIDDVMSWEPCYSREEILKRTDGSTEYDIEYMVSSEEFSVDDKIWLLLRERFFSEQQLHSLACDFAEHVLPIYEAKYSDTRPHHVIETKRRWIVGDATDEELTLACDAARAAVRAAEAVALAAASAAASAAAWATARADEREWQLKRILEIANERK